MKQQNVGGSAGTAAAAAQSGQQDKQKVNKPSSLLSNEENEHVFGLLGRRCQSMCTAVVQLYTTEPPTHSMWIKRHTGAVCLVRDSSKRSYFIRVYCLIKNELVWEEEIYEQIYINKSKEYLLDFEGRECLVALNFASESEANNFYKTALSHRTKRKQATNKRRSRVIPPPARNSSSKQDDQENTVVLRNAGSSMQMSQFSQPYGGGGEGGLNRDKKRVNRKITKADISLPTDFKHVFHVGWTAQKGFDLNGEEVNNLNAFLEKAGVSEQQLNDRETRAFIYDFIQSNNVLDSVKDEQSGKHEPPPVPSRSHNGTQRMAPAPPPPIMTTNTTATSAPTRQPPPPLPKTTPPRGAPPGRPPPITNVSATPAAPPPPPPPPPPMMAPMPPPAPSSSNDLQQSSNVKNTTIEQPRNALMESIRKGTTLKKVDSTNSNSSGGDNRTDLLSEIRQGIELKSASSREIPTERKSTGAGGTDALAEALRRALEKRGKDMRISDDDSDESSENDGEWED